MADEAPRTTFPDATLLSVDRSLLAHDRTLMAWTRTATSLISFGFTIYTFFKNAASSPKLFGARHVALLMISIGLTCLVLATIGHLHDVRGLQKQYGVKPHYLTAVLAGLVSFLGIVGLLAVLLHQ